MKKMLFILIFSMSLNAMRLYDEELEQLPKKSQLITYDSYVAQGKQLLEQHDYMQALDLFKKALTCRPAEFKSCVELGNCLLRLGNHFFDTRNTTHALDAFKSILEISPSIAAAHHNIAFTLAEEVGDFHTAIKYYKKALELAPDNIETHFCLSMSYLATGDLLNGFREYEIRWQRVKHSPRSFNYPLPQQWDGSQSISGKRILIRVEQGFGDTLHFIRYAQLLKGRGAVVIAEVQEALIPLVSLSEYIDEVVTIGNPVPPFDVQIPMLNLPLVFKTTLATIPAQIPYLRAHPQLVSAWRNNLQHDKNFKIGVCWRGDPTHGAHKFLPFEYFERLSHLPGISLYSLQKFDPALAQSNPSLLAKDTHIQQFDGDFDASHGRFMDTAAVMKNLDLILTVDTSIAHLAGGLGVPVWVIVPFPAEWRWLTQRSDSPWYPTMRLFRQQAYGDWEPAYNELLQALAEKVRQYAQK